MREHILYISATVCVILLFIVPNENADCACEKEEGREGGGGGGVEATNEQKRPTNEQNRPTNEQKRPTNEQKRKGEREEEEE